MTHTKNNFLRIAALGLAIAVVLGLLYGKRVTAALQHDHPLSASGGERKPLYWYDAMNPDHHYDKPGKAPDGMDLVPMYADQATPASTLSSPSERKILFWYDPMHPQYKSDKPGKAPDCGMDLVPKYADEQAVSMAPGSVMISAAKQQLIGVRTVEARREFHGPAADCTPLTNAVALAVTLAVSSDEDEYRDEETEVAPVVPVVPERRAPSHVPRAALLGEALWTLGMLPRPTAGECPRFSSSTVR